MVTIASWEGGLYIRIIASLGVQRPLIDLMVFPKKKTYFSRDLFHQQFQWTIILMVDLTYRDLPSKDLKFTNHDFMDVFSLQWFGTHNKNLEENIWIP